MNFQQALAKAAPSKDTVVTIGTFDGVHLGHQWMLKRVTEMAGARDLASVLLTFRNHPRLVLNPGMELRYLTNLNERESLLRGQGVDQVVLVDFTRELSMLKAEEFVGLLTGHLRMRGLVGGPDFAVGFRREGDMPTLERLGSERGFWVEPVEPVLMDKIVIKSSVIRSLLAQGDVANAARMLGRSHSLTGMVVTGDRRGRQLGFPTANLAVEADLVLPGDGIYATWAIVEGQRHQAATCIGVRPTFGGSRRVVEAFILDFQGDLYGKPVTLEFAGRLREESAFPSAEALVAQMELDVEQTRVVLANPPEALPMQA